MSHPQFDSMRAGLQTKCEAASHWQCSHTLPPSLQTHSRAIMLLFIQYDICLFLAGTALNTSGIKHSMTAPCAILNKYRVKGKVFSQTMGLGRRELHQDSGVLHLTQAA